MKQRESDLKFVLNVLKKYDSAQSAASARKLLTEGLPFAVPVPEAAPEGASSGAVHSFQKQFVAYIEKLFSEAKEKAAEDLAAEATKIEEAGAELESLREEAAKAQKALEEVIATLDAKKAHITELAAKASVHEANHDKHDKKADKQKLVWENLRRDHESAKAVEEGALRMLEDDEGDEDLRGDAASGVTSFLEGQGAEKVLQIAAPFALAVKPSNRRRFDSMTVEAVSSLVKKRVAELGERVANMEPEEKQLRAEITGLWALADCARDLITEAKTDLFAAEPAQAASESAKEDASKRVKDQEALMKELDAAKTDAEAREQELGDASAGLTRLVMGAEAVEEGNDEPTPKRQRVEAAE